jgi:endo-1,4-beta-xylanase
MATALAEPALKVVITWGLSDRYSWFNVWDAAPKRADGRPARPLPFDEAFMPKPAYDALRRAFAARRA